MLSEEEFRELRDIRLAPEGLATERAVSLITPAEIQLLRNGPYLHLRFPDYAGKEQGKLRAQTLAAIKRRDAAAARR